MLITVQPVCSGHRSLELAGCNRKVQINFYKLGPNQVAAIRVDRLYIRYWALLIKISHQVEYTGLVWVFCNAIINSLSSFSTLFSLDTYNPAREGSLLIL